MVRDDLCWWARYDGSIWFYITPEQAALFMDSPFPYGVRLASVEEIMREFALEHPRLSGTMPAVSR